MRAHIKECPPKSGRSIDDGCLEFLDASSVLFGQKTDALWESWSEACEAAGQLLAFPPELADAMKGVVIEIVKPRSLRRCVNRLKRPTTRLNKRGNPNIENLLRH